MSVLDLPGSARSTSTVFVLAAIFVFLWPRSSVAQIKIDDDKSVIRVAIGRAITGTQSVAQGSMTGTVSYEHRVGRTVWIRAQTQFAGWDLVASPIRPSADRMAVSSVTAAITKTIDYGILQPYFGAGFGAYHFRFRPTSFGSEVRPGGFFVAGIQFPNPTNTFGGYLEVNLGYVGGPQTAQLFELGISLGSFLAGVKISF